MKDQDNASGNSNEESYEALLKLAQSGDSIAFGRLFEPLRLVLTRVAAGIVGDSDADDAVMDAMLRAWKALPDFNGGSSLRTWAVRIVRNASLDILRKRKRRGEISLDDPDDESGRSAVENLPDLSASAPDRSMTEEETRRDVASALASIGSLHRAVLELFYIEEMSYKEIAGALGISIGTVMSRLSNAKKRLADAMNKVF